MNYNPFGVVLGICLPCVKTTLILLNVVKLGREKKNEMGHGSFYLHDP